jgi:hypothetical protein
VPLSPACSTMTAGHREEHRATRSSVEPRRSDRIGIGGSRWSRLLPSPPPYVRVRIRRFAELRWTHSRSPLSSVSAPRRLACDTPPYPQGFTPTLRRELRVRTSADNAARDSRSVALLHVRPFIGRAGYKRLRHPSRLLRPLLTSRSTAHAPVRVALSGIRRDLPRACPGLDPG